MPIALGNIANSAAASIYTSVGNTAITFLSLTNYSASNVTANVFVVPSGNTAANLNVILSQIEIATLDTYQLYAGGEKLLLSNGDSIQANANVNSSITTVTSYTTI